MSTQTTVWVGLGAGGKLDKVETLGVEIIDEAALWSS